MLVMLRRFLQAIPTLITAFLLAVTIWIVAVTASDPNEERTYPGSVPIEIVGQDPGLLLISQVPAKLELSLNAPRSIWEQLLREQAPVRAIVDLSGLSSGEHTVPVQVQVSIRPVKVASYTPQSLTISLEGVTSRTIPITLIQRGEVAVGFEAEIPTLSQKTITISGAESIVRKVKEVRVIADLKSAAQNINRNLKVIPVDSNDVEIQGLTIVPETVNYAQVITQRGGFRNVVVKVVTAGQVARGYRVINISVSPPAITVYSSDTKLVDNLPGYVETVPLDMNNLKEGLDIRLGLNLPAGISVVGEQNVQVQVGISSIESSLTLSNMPVKVIGVGKGLEARISPLAVDVILSGPLPVLDTLTSSEVVVIIDLTGVQPGTYQLIPRVEISREGLRVQSILPGSIEVTIMGEDSAGTATPPVQPSPSPTP